VCLVQLKFNNVSRVPASVRITPRARRCLLLLQPEFTGRIADGMPFGIGGEHDTAAAMRRNGWGQIARYLEARAEPNALRATNSARAARQRRSLVRLAFDMSAQAGRSRGDYFGLGRRGSGQNDVFARARPPPIPTGTPSARQHPAPVMVPSGAKVMAHMPPPT
jgi:hypothetical protein